MVRNPFRQTQDVKRFKEKERLIRQAAFREEKLKLARQKGLKQAREGTGIKRGLRRVSKLNFSAATTSLAPLLATPGEGEPKLRYDPLKGFVPVNKPAPPRRPRNKKKRRR